MARDARGLPDQPAEGTESDGGVTGLSNDYLNHYVEVLLLIEMAPHDPTVCADLSDWWPISYVEYFSSSQLDHASRAKAAYEALPSEDRRRFERLVAAMEHWPRWRCSLCSHPARQTGRRLSLMPQLRSFDA
jgi:hypothetical protein